MEPSFTGVPDLDIKILNELDDQSLASVCQTDKYTQDLCSRGELWKQRVEKYIDKLPPMTYKEIYNYFKDPNVYLVIDNTFSEGPAYEIFKTWKDAAEYIVDIATAPEREVVGYTPEGEMILGDPIYSTYTEEEVMTDLYSTYEWGVFQIIKEKLN